MWDDNHYGAEYTPATGHRVRSEDVSLKRLIAGRTTLQGATSVTVGEEWSARTA